MRRIIMLTIALMLAASAASATPTYERDDETLYLHWDDCGAESRTYLSVVAPASENTCGFIGGTPVSTPFTLLEDPFVDTFTAADGLPVRLDGEGQITGQVAVHSWTGLTGAGAGFVFADVTLSGFVGNTFVQLGYFEGEELATPGDDHVSFEFAFDVDGSLNEKVLTGLELDVNIWGAYVDSGVHTTGGLSQLTLPILVEVDQGA